MRLIIKAGKAKFDLELYGGGPNVAFKSPCGDISFFSTNELGSILKTAEGNMNADCLDKLIVPSQPNFTAIDSLVITRLADGTFVTNLIQVTVGASHNILVSQGGLSNLLGVLPNEVKKGTFNLVFAVTPKRRKNKH